MGTKGVSWRLAQVPPPSPPAQPAQGSDQAGASPLDKFESETDLENYLAQVNDFPNGPMARRMYDEVADALGNDPSAKEALTAFYSGLEGGLNTLWQMFVMRKKANPISTDIVEKVKMSNPNLGQQAPQGAHPEAQAGLFLPPADSGIHTTAESTAGIEKTAGGGIGGAGAGYPAYSMGGPEEKRMCPKIRNVVSTYICRYHCLDGLAIDDHQVLCGEAIWRQSVMDKFSREHKDADGNWVGGYLNKRFEIDRNDGGHPMQLKPGQRHAPIHEDAWNMEKRLQEMRRAEGKDRGYSDTPGDPKGLYNFDPHDVAKGPKAPNLSEKDKDPIAKIASGEKWSREAAKNDKTVSEDKFKRCKEEVKENSPGANEYAVCTDSMGGQPASYHKKKDKKKAGFNLSVKKAFREPGPQDMFAGKECPSCHRKYHEGVQNCEDPRCRGAQLTIVSKPAAQIETGGIPSPNFSMASANGVYRASKDGRNAYGSDPVEAQNKLHQIMNNQSVEQESDDLLHDLPPMAQVQQQPAQVAPPAAQPVQQQQQPPEIQGGQSHFPGTHIDASELEQVHQTERNPSLDHPGNKWGLHPDRRNDNA